MAETDGVDNAIVAVVTAGGFSRGVTLIAGIYGMNFRYMPELDWTPGYPLALGMMVVGAIGLAWYFRWRHWL